MWTTNVLQLNRMQKYEERSSLKAGKRPFCLQFLILKGQYIISATLCFLVINSIMRAECFLVLSNRILLKRVVWRTKTERVTETVIYYVISLLTCMSYLCWCGLKLTTSKRGTQTNAHDLMIWTSQLSSFFSSPDPLCAGWSPHCCSRQNVQLFPTPRQWWRGCGQFLRGLFIKSYWVRTLWAFPSGVWTWIGSK